MALQCPLYGHHGCISYGMFYLASQWTATGLNPVCLAPKLPLGFAADRPYCGPFTTLLLVLGRIISLLCKQVSNNTRLNRMGTPDGGVLDGVLMGDCQMECIYICWVHSGELDYKVLT